MRRVQWRSVKFYSLLILAITAISMFETSCSQEETIERPSATFIIKGKAVSDEDQKPLDSILVIMMENTAGVGPVKDVNFLTVKDSAITDQNGNFVVADSFGIPAEMSYTLLFKDLKNELKSNGEVRTNSFIQEFLAPKFTLGDGRWYGGEVSVEKTFPLNTK